MPTRLTFREHDLVLFEGYYHWVDIKRFGIDPLVGDRELLATLIADSQYHDHYAGEDAEDQHHHSLHGPYELTAIDAATFVPTTPASASEGLRTWLEQWLDGSNERTQILEQFRTAVLPIVAVDNVYRLPDMRPDAEHD